MPANKFLITHQPSGGTLKDITNMIRLTEQEGIQTTADTFNFFVLDKPKGTISGGATTTLLFNKNDRIRIYMWKEGESPATVQDGVIKDYTLNITPDGRLWQVSGQNGLEVLLNVPMPAKYNETDANNTAPKIIKNLVNQALARWITSIYNPQITAELKSIDATNGKINDQPSIDGSTWTFPSIKFQKTPKPVFYMINELSGTKYTGVSAKVGKFIYYLDKNNRFVWEPKGFTVDTTAPNSGIISEGMFSEVKISRDLVDAINFLIINAGQDFTGKQITTYVYNPTAQKSGIRGGYIALPEIAWKLKDQTTISNSAPFGTKDIDGNTNNQTFRNKVRDSAKGEGSRLIDESGNPRFQAQIIMAGTTAYTIGKLYTISIANAFRDVNNVAIDNMNMRLVEQQQQITSNGWRTILNFKQDETDFVGEL